MIVISDLEGRQFNVVGMRLPMNRDAVIELTTLLTETLTLSNQYLSERARRSQLYEQSRLPSQRALEMPMRRTGLLGPEASTSSSTQKQ